MADEERKIRIAAALEEVVWPGETWTIRRVGAKFEVEEGDRSSLADSQPELYGRLLQINEKLSEAGGSLIIVAMIATLAACIGIHLHWLEQLVGPKIDAVRSFWFYGFALVAAFFGSLYSAKAWEGVVYRRLRDNLLRAISDAGLTPHKVLVQIEGDDALDDLADQLKTDPDPL